MRKIFTLVVLFLLTEQFVTAQTVTSSTFNFQEAAAYEAAHPELFKPCPTCPRKEADGGWEDFVNPNMPFPPGANIKMSDPLPKRNPNEPRPDVPSRAPVQNFLGHVDPGNIIPPDTYGAVGLTQVVTATNDFIKVHAKVGGAQISQVSISSFAGTPSTCDPQLFFDPNLQRWIFAAIGCAGNGNPVILMTSNTADATGTWRRITWVPLPTGLLDHPYLGYDDTKIMIGGRKFNSASGPDLYLIDKADMFSGAAIVFGTNAQTITKTAADGDSPRPVTVYFPPFSNSGNPSPGTMYVVQSWNNTSLRLTTVTGNIPTAVWNTGSAVFPSAPAPEAWTSGSHGNGGSVAQQPPESRLLAANDSRTSSAVMMNGKIWVAQHCAFPAGASGGAVTHTDVQYWQLDGAPGGTFGNVIQRGRTGAVAGEHRWFSSIAVNKSEDVLVGYTLSSTTGLPSAAYSTRQASTPPNTLDDPRVYHAGESRYWKDFGSGRPRWGDYSQAHLDPVDNSLWAIQEYASTYVGFPGTFSDNNSRSGVWWAQVPPSVVVPTPIIAPAGATLVSESCVPNNGVIDPGETVTVSFCIQNTGAAPTVNAVGTLLVSGGVISPSAPQNYGVVVNGGPPVCRNFTFTNNSTTCGSTITASLQVQDGASNLGTVTYNFTLGTTVVASTQNFDAVVAPALPAGWVATNAAGPAPFWVTSSAGTPAPAFQSAPNALFIDDPGVVSDKRIESPAFVPGAGATATFRNNYDLENTFDGGVLEISINGGAYADILAAGGSFVAGGYNGTISVNFQNPIGGRAAWTNTSGGFITTTVNLPNSAAGQSVKLRWRMGSDNLFSDVGWRIDDFSVSQPACCGAPCALTCPANITVNSASNACGANVSFAASATGLCGPITYSPASGSFFPVGTTTVNVSSASGATCSFTVTVVDNTPPTITCPAPVVASNTPGLCSAVVNYTLPNVTDNCPLPGQYLLTQSAATSIVPIQIGCQSGGLTTENSWWRAYDLAPLALPAPLTIRTVTFGIETANAASGSIPVNVRLYTSAGAFPGGTRTQIASQTVSVPNQAGTLFTVNLTTPPTVPANAIVAVEINVPDGRAPVNHTFFIGSNASGQTGPSYLQAADCGAPNPVTLASLGFPNDHIIINMSGTVPVTPPVLSLVSGIASGGVFPVGVTTNTYQARDAAGLTSTCSFTVTVNDVQAPTVTCPANIVRNTDPGACIATIATPNPTTADNCAVTKVTWVMTGATTGSSPATGINFVGTKAFNLTGTTGQGITTITYTVSDAAGNSTQCSYTVTVNDGQIPVISAQPANQFVCVGSNGAFSVTASVPTGSPLAYKWQKWDGATSTWVDVPGGTSASLPLNAVAFSQNTNSYRVILTGLCSVVTSNYATLYVNRLPSLTLAASRIPVLLPGEFVNLVATVDPTGGTFQWIKDGTPIVGASGNTLAGLSVDDIGAYRVRYTDGNGCVSLSNEIVVSGAPSGNLYVFPNPNFGQFSVRFFNQVGENATITVFDAKGARVYQRQMVTTTAYTRLDIDLGPTISSGVYLVEVVNSAGKSIGGKRIIVRHH